MIMNESMRETLKVLGREALKLPAKRLEALVYTETFLFKLMSNRSKNG